MPLGGATKKLQKVADMGEELYARMNELREQIVQMRETVQDTNRRVDALENRLDQQGAILEALAEAEDVDVDAIVTETAIEEAEPAVTGVDAAEDEASDAETDANVDVDADDGADTDGEAGDDSATGE